jgi:cyclopropane fatty-acyl-phospholipid synthase-like methyltransferase
MKRSDNYQDLFTNEFLMGPNSVRLIEEMLEKHPLKANSRVLDLGCGKGLTSLFLEKEAGANVFATDLWISATENNRRFEEWGISEKVIPIHADANDLPFAEEYFDAIISIDSFHYFATKPKFLEEKILPLVKKDGVIIIAMPGLKEEIHGKEPAIIMEWVNAEANEYELYHSRKWWLKHFGESEKYEVVMDFDLDSFNTAWEDWFATKHEYALHDEQYFEKGVSEYLAIVGFVIHKKK